MGVERSTSDVCAASEEGRTDKSRSRIAVAPDCPCFVPTARENLVNLVALVRAKPRVFWNDFAKLLI
jgi:hypothetical protein